MIGQKPAILPTEPNNLQLSFIVPLIAYAYVAFYGAKGHSIGRKLGNP